MKRTEIRKNTSEKAYEMDLSEVFKVIFTKDFGAFKKGDTSYVSLPLAMKFTKMGVVENSIEISNAAEKYGCNDFIRQTKSNVKE